MRLNLKKMLKGMSVFIPYKNGKIIKDSHGRPRIYTSITTALQYTPDREEYILKKYDLSGKYLVTEGKAEEVPIGSCIVDDYTSCSICGKPTRFMDEEFHVPICSYHCRSAYLLKEDLHEPNN